MNLRIGDVNPLIVNRKTDIGYILDSNEGEVFLHNNESNHMKLAPGDQVDAFLYFDQKGRLAATLKAPYITISKPGFLSVTDVLPDLGVFLDMGISKELLLSKDDLPTDFEKWPKHGDQIYASIKIKNKLVCKIPGKDEITLKPESTLKLKDHIDAYVYKIGKEGLNLLTTSGHQIFVHNSQYKGIYRLGELVNVKIIYISEKGYSGQLSAQKEISMHDDAQEVLTYLARHDVLPLTSDSSPEDIAKYFKMSKKAFKRALGTLYKQRKITFKDDRTVLVRNQQVKS
jgi:uncharacterized protein